MKLVKQERELLGTKVSIELPSSFSFLFESCFDELVRIEKTYSRFLESSKLSLLNKKLDVWQTVSEEFFFLIEKGLEYNKKTKGYFDMTLKSTLDNLGYDKEYSFTKKEVTTSSPKKSFFFAKKDVELDNGQLKVLLRKEIEIGGFGKGFAVDLIKTHLETNGVKEFVINAGGDMFISSKEHPVTIYLEHPTDMKKVMGEVKISYGAIASSSPSRRKWKDGHHLINAKTKLPDQSIQQIFVLADSCMDADAYATALFSAGFVKATSLARKLPVEIYMLSTDGEPFMTSGFKAEFYG